MPVQQLLTWINDLACVHPQEATLMLASGRRYGLVGRNGTGKTTLMRALATHSIKGIPDTMQILHVEQEVGVFLWEAREGAWMPGDSALRVLRGEPFLRRGGAVHAHGWA